MVSVVEIVGFWIDFVICLIFSLPIIWTFTCVKILWTCIECVLRLLKCIRLDIPPEKVPKILTPEVLADLEAKYLENMKDEYKLWMSNTMKLEEEDWKRDKEPGQATKTIFSFWSTSL